MMRSRDAEAVECALVGWFIFLIFCRNLYCSAGAPGRHTYEFYVPAITPCVLTYRVMFIFSSTIFNFEFCRKNISKIKICYGNITICYLCSNVN